MKNLLLIAAACLALWGCGGSESTAPDIDATANPDSEGPTVVVDFPVDNGIYGRGRILMQGTAEPAGGILGVEVSLDDGSFAAAEGCDVWSFDCDTSALGDGEHRLTARAFDASGNTGQTMVRFSIDGALPLAVLFNTPPLIANTPSIGITVAGPSICAYRYSIDRGDWSDERQTAEIIDGAVLPDGVHTLAVVGKNTDGVWQDRNNPTIFAWTIDTVTPQLAFRICGDPEIVTRSDITLLVESNDGSTMRLSNNGITWGEWMPYAPECPWTLENGTGLRTIFVELQDRAGNVSRSSVSVLVVTGGSITASDGHASDRYGSTIGMSADGSILICGAPLDLIGDRPEQGALYVHRWNGAGYDEYKIAASDGAARDNFGNHAAISADGSVVAIGAWLGDANYSNQGAAYVYRLVDGIYRENKITAFDGATGDHFGSAIAISGDGTTLVVGAREDNIGSRVDQGSVYVYRFDADTVVAAKLTAAAGAAHDGFGAGLAISHDGKTIAVGAPFKSAGTSLQAGGVSIFAWNGAAWIETAIAPGGALAGENFGAAVALSGDGSIVAVGSPG